MIVLWLFLAVPWVCLQFVSVVFPDHTHYFFIEPIYVNQRLGTVCAHMDRRPAICKRTHNGSNSKR